MQWLIDIVKEWIITQGYLTAGFVDRGDPASKDFTLPNFTTDFTWRDLDLSAIVPEGAKAVLLRLGINAAVGNAYIFLRTKGNVNEINMSLSRTQYSGLQQDAEPTIPLGEDRVIQYKAKNVTWTVIDCVVKNWWF